MKSLFSVILILISAVPALCQEHATNQVLLQRVGDTAFIQLHAPSFQALSPQQQALAYWLTQASIAIDPISYDQMSAYGSAKRDRSSLSTSAITMRTACPAGTRSSGHCTTIVICRRSGIRNRTAALDSCSSRADSISR